MPTQVSTVDASTGARSVRWVGDDGHDISEAQALALLVNRKTVATGLATSLPDLATPAQAPDLANGAGLDTAMVTITAYAGLASPTAAQTAAALKAVCTVLTVAVPAVRKMYDWVRANAKRQRLIVRQLTGDYSGSD